MVEVDGSLNNVILKSTKLNGKQNISSIFSADLHLSYQSESISVPILKPVASGRTRQWTDTFERQCWRRIDRKLGFVQNKILFLALLNIRSNFQL
jgi:hypothetical protein